MSDQQQGGDTAVAEIRLWKLLVVGDYAAGKTSLIRRFVEKTFHNHFWPCMDFSIHHITLDGVVHKLQIWDTFGGERWGPRFVGVSYYRRVQAAILVYDITNRRSYESLVEKWMMGFRINTAKSDHKVLPVIVGSKLDLQGQRQVFPEEAEAYARSIGALFYETSSRTGENVDLVFEQTIKRLITEGIPSIRRINRDLAHKQQTANQTKEKSCILS